MQLVISWSTGEKAISEAFDDALQKKSQKCYQRCVSYSLKMSSVSGCFPKLIPGFIMQLKHGKGS